MKAIVETVGSLGELEWNDGYRRLLEDLRQRRSGRGRLECHVTISETFGDHGSSRSSNGRERLLDIEALVDNLMPSLHQKTGDCNNR